MLAVDWSGGWVPEAVKDVAGRLVRSGHEAYLVGGCVRDFVMGIAPHDFDLATDALPERVMELFPNSIPTGAKFGTVTVLAGQGGHPVEVTTYRSEGAYLDGRHPSEVRFGVSLPEDLARRDFTMNAMALEPFTGVLADPLAGQEDIRQGVVRAVGDPRTRFDEDKLRMLMAVRFAATLGFEVEASTLSAIAEMSSGIGQVAVERTAAELEKLLLAPAPSRGIELMRRTGLLEAVLPEVMWGWEVDQNRHHEFTVYYHTMHCLDAVKATPVLRWAALLHDIGKPSVKQGDHFYGHEKAGAELAQKAMARLKLSGRLAKAVVHLISHHMIGYNPRWSDAAIRKLIARVGPDRMGELLELHRADMAAKGDRNPEERTAKYLELCKRVEAELGAGRSWSVSGLAVDGDDVAKVVGGPGPLVGKVLSELHRRVVELPDINTRGKLLAIARDMAKAAGPGRRENVEGRRSHSKGADVAHIGPEV